MTFLVCHHVALVDGMELIGMLSFTKLFLEGSNSPKDELYAGSDA